MNLVGEWLQDKIKMSGQSEYAAFADCLSDTLIEMDTDGKTKDEIDEHLLSMADNFIEVAQAFKKEFSHG